MTLSASDESPSGGPHAILAGGRRLHAVGWFEAFVDRRLEREKVRFACVAILATSLLLAVVSFATFDGSQSIFGPAPGADFAGFYTAGRILSTYPPSRVYDLELQDRVFHELMPRLPLDTKLPYVYPPFFTFLFEPLASLSYSHACLVWMVISASLYLCGFAAIWRTREGFLAGQWPMALLLALSFEPFVECWLSGQTSAFGFAALAWAIHYESRNQPFRAGTCLSICLYKPPLLLVLVPLLVVARRWRVLSGFAIGGASLGSISLFAFGSDGCLAYVRVAAEFSRLINANMAGFPRWKYVDLNNFFAALMGGQPLAGRALWAASLLAVIPWIVRSWWSYNQSCSDRRALLWSSAITWTLVLNFYVGIYDTILAAIAAMMTSDVLLKRAGGLGTSFASGFRNMLALLYLVPWFSQHVARLTGFQPFTLVLIALAAYQLILASRAGPTLKTGDPTDPLSGTSFYLGK